LPLVASGLALAGGLRLISGSALLELGLLVVGTLNTKSLIKSIHGLWVALALVELMFGLIHQMALVHCGLCGRNNSQ